MFCRALGSLSPTHKVDVEYPLAFQEAFIKRRSQTQMQTQKPADFRYVHVSGKFVEQDSDRKLYFLEVQRKTKVYSLLYFTSSSSSCLPG